MSFQGRFNGTRRTADDRGDGAAGSLFHHIEAMQPDVIVQLKIFPSGHSDRLRTERAVDVAWYPWRVMPHTDTAAIGALLFPLEPVAAFAVL